MRAESPAATRLIWDLPVRATHWLLAVCVAGSFATHYAGIEWFEWHRRFGYTTLVLVAFRLVWGVVGTRYARFAEFLRGPRATLSYLREGAPPTAGHNPLGAWSVLALLACLLLQAATGLFANDSIANTGPFFGWVSQARSDRLSGLHHLNANVLAALLGLHIAAVLWYARVLRRPLLKAMLTGRKDAAVLPADAGIGASRSALALVIVALLTAVLALAIRAAPEATLSLF